MCNMWDLAFDTHLVSKHESIHPFMRRLLQQNVQVKFNKGEEKKVRSFEIRL